MSKILTIGTIVLGCCLAGVAQTGSTANQDQAVPGNAESQSSSALQSANLKTTVQGCLSHSPEGKFMLADAVENQYELKGKSAHLNQFVGQEIRVKGLESAASSSAPGAMSSKAPLTPSELQESAWKITVSKITKIADTCQTSSGGKY